MLQNVVFSFRKGSIDKNCPIIRLPPPNNKIPSTKYLVPPQLGERGNFLPTTFCDVSIIDIKVSDGGFLQK